MARALRDDEPDVDSVLRAISEPTRRRILQALRERERCVLDLTRSLQLSQPLVSHHLAVLREAGLVGTRRDRRFTLFALNLAALARAYEALGSLLSPESLPPEAMSGGNPRCCA